MLPRGRIVSSAWARRIPFLRAADRKLNQRRGYTRTDSGEPKGGRGGQPPPGDRLKRPGNKVEEDSTEGQGKDTHADQGRFHATQGIPHKGCRGIFDRNVMRYHWPCGRGLGITSSVVLGVDRNTGTMRDFRYLMVNAENVHAEQAQYQRNQNESRLKGQSQECSAFRHGVLTSLEFLSNRPSCHNVLPLPQQMLSAGQGLQRLPSAPQRPAKDCLY